MTMIIDTHTLAVWFVPLTERSDFLAHLCTTQEGKILLQYRIREYAEDENKEDKKTWMQGEFTGDRDIVIPHTRKFIEHLARMYNNPPIEEILMGDGDIDTFIDTLLSKDFCHTIFDKSKLH